MPLNRLSAPFAYDADAAIGVCGDWFTHSDTNAITITNKDTNTDGLEDTEKERSGNRERGGDGPSLEAAFLSGTALARQISQHLLSGDTNSVGIGAMQRFEAMSADAPPLGSVSEGYEERVKALLGPELGPVGAGAAGGGGGSGGEKRDGKGGQRQRQRYRGKGRSGGEKSEKGGGGARK